VTRRPVQGAELAPVSGHGVGRPEAWDGVMRPERIQKVEMSVSSTVDSASASGLRPATILVAEDHLDSRDALRALLEAVGYHVIEAVNGRQAVDVALECDPDLILMDIMMPELDGFEATRELRRHDLTSATPIIAVTAMEGAQQLAIQAGANDFVRKPVDIRGLVAKVHDWLEPPLS
jgi:CheY-like chemotaxis protein